MILSSNLGFIRAGAEETIKRTRINDEAHLDRYLAISRALVSATGRLTFVN